VYRCDLDPPRAAAYIAAYEDVVDRIEPPPPPYYLGTGAHSRLNVPVPPDFGCGIFFQITPALLAFVR
jgi:hypothetical protein